MDEWNLNISKPTSRKRRPLKSKLHSRKGRTKSAINTQGEKHSRRKETRSFYTREENNDNNPIGKRVHRKLKDEPRNQKKLIHEPNRDQKCIYSPDGNPPSSAGLEIYDIEKRYRALLPAIKSAILEHANVDMSSLKDVISINRPSKYGVTHVQDTISDCLNTKWRIQDPFVEPSKQSDNLAEVYNDSESSRGDQPFKRKSPKYRPAGDGMMVLGLASRNTAQSITKIGLSRECINNVVNNAIHKSTRLDHHKVDDEKTLKEQNDYQNHRSQKVWAVEQNRLCAGPNSYWSGGRHSISRSITKVPSDHQQTSNAKSNLDIDKCKCEYNLENKPCTCNCYCKEFLAVGESSIPEDTSKYSILSSSIHEFPKMVQENIEVQTSFPSSIGPCSPDTCPNRNRPRIAENREIEVQTDNTDIEWRHENTMVQPKRAMFTTFKIPTKRMATMDDRLLRRIMFFNAHPNSVCNKNVPFCTYTVVNPTKKISKGTGNVTCPDCPNKCHVVLKKDPNHLTCNEIAIEVRALELNQEGAESLAKVCLYVYIDYVFLGHVGNETALAPVSNNILFDSRKSYSVSMRFNRKERSILREQFKPSGLLVKDSIMFIIVCQAAPELGIKKNWDFGFGHMSMKRIRERMGLKDRISLEVEMQKISGPKNNIGKLLVIFEGLTLIRNIMCEELNCVEPQLDAAMEKLNLNRTQIKGDSSEKVHTKSLKN